MGKSSLLIWCGNLILQKDLHHVYLILRNLLYLIKLYGYYLMAEQDFTYSILLGAYLVLISPKLFIAQCSKKLKRVATHSPELLCRL